MYILENNSTPFSQTNRRGTHSVSVSAQGILFYSFHWGGGEGERGGGEGGGEEEGVYVSNDASTWTSVPALQDPLDEVSPYCKLRFNLLIQQIH